MKKLLILAIVTILLVLSGCTKNNTSSGDISSADNILNASQIEETESTTSENNGNVNSNTSNNSEVSSTDSKPSKVESKPSTPATTTSSSKPETTTSKPEVTPSKPADTSSESKPSEPQYKTIKFYEVTTYYGFTGYFGTIQSDIILKELGLGEDNFKAAKGITEYYNVDTGEPIFFIMNANQGMSRDIADKADENAGRASIPVKVI